MAFAIRRPTPPPLMAKFPDIFLPQFFSFAIESYIYETINSVNSYSAVLPPSPMVFFYRNCLDKVRLGGQNKLKQKCLEKRFFFYFFESKVFSNIFGRHEKSTFLEKVKIPNSIVWAQDNKLPNKLFDFHFGLRTSHD